MENVKVYPISKETQITQTFVLETVAKVKMLNSTVLKSHILKN